jgi:hypothetical protein
MAPFPLWIGAYSFSNTKQAQDEVDTLISYHFGEERFRRHDPKKIVKEHFNKLGVPWEYTSEVWEEEEVHCGARTYDEVITRRQGKPIGRIIDEEKA